MASAVPSMPPPPPPDADLRRSLIALAHEEAAAGRAGAAAKAAMAALTAKGAAGAVLLPVDEAHLRLQMARWATEAAGGDEECARNRLYAEKSSFERAAVVLHNVPGWKHFATTCAVQWRLAYACDELHSTHRVAGGLTAQARRALAAGAEVAQNAAQKAREANDEGACREARLWADDFAWALAELDARAA